MNLRTVTEICFYKAEELVYFLSLTLAQSNIRFPLWSYLFAPSSPPAAVSLKTFTFAESGSATFQDLPNFQL